MFVSFHQWSISVSGCTNTSAGTNDGEGTSSAWLFIPAAVSQSASTSQYSRPAWQILTEHNMFPIQPVTFGARNEKLTAVSTWTTVCLGVENVKIQNYDFPKLKAKISHIRKICCLRTNLGFLFFLSLLLYKPKKTRHLFAGEYPVLGHSVLPSQSCQCVQEPRQLLLMIILQRHL